MWCYYMKMYLFKIFEIFIKINYCGKVVFIIRYKGVFCECSLGWLWVKIKEVNSENIVVNIVV